ncbi:thiamine phosphate synthase [Veillonella ratti]|uniref:thiamine phosphate synthase n=1 Tax=Veillonella ratti TaxID=103892 RepID=UPI000F8F57DD|nr:thiamine phosphate synthase [Veillonella ratti]
MTTSESNTNKATMNTGVAAKKQVSPLAPKKLTYVTHLPALYEFLKKSNSTNSATAYLKTLICAKPDNVLLRAKELPVQDYEKLLTELLPIANKAGVQLIVSHHIDLAVKYNLPVQLSVAECIEATAQTVTDGVLSQKTLRPTPLPFGVSVHSLLEAKAAITHGADWLVLGHLFPSRCKPGLTPRNTEECRHILELAATHRIPIHGIGGINFTTYPQLPKAYAGICVMTETMEQPDIESYTKKWHEIMADK